MPKLCIPLGRTDQRTAKAVVVTSTNAGRVELPPLGSRSSIHLTQRPVAEALVAMIRASSTPDVYISTWSLSRHELTAVLEACSSARPRLFLADKSIESRSGLRLLDEIAAVFERVVVTQTHAKVYIAGNYAMLTSCNLSRPRGLESRVVWHDPGVVAEVVSELEAAASNGRLHK
jgi:hypothetical protein